MDFAFSGNYSRGKGKYRFSGAFQSDKNGKIRGEHYDKTQNPEKRFLEGKLTSSEGTNTLTFILQDTNENNFNIQYNLTKNGELTGIYIGTWQASPKGKETTFTGQMVESHTIGGRDYYPSKISQPMTPNNQQSRSEGVMLHLMLSPNQQT